MTLTETEIALVVLQSSPAHRHLIEEWVKEQFKNAFLALVEIKFL